MRRKTGLQQNKLAIARNDIVDDLVVAVAFCQPVAHQQTQIAREIGIGIVDGLILADHAAKLRGNLPRPRLERRVAQHLIRLDCGGTDREQYGQKQNGNPHHSAAPMACAGCVLFLLSAGAPIRKRRSESETTPPVAISTNPSQMHRMKGFHHTRTTQAPP